MPFAVPPKAGLSLTALDSQPRWEKSSVFRANPNENGLPANTHGFTNDGHPTDIPLAASITQEPRTGASGSAAERRRGGGEEGEAASGPQEYTTRAA